MVKHKCLAGRLCRSIFRWLNPYPFETPDSHGRALSTHITVRVGSFNGPKRTHYLIYRQVEVGKNWNSPKNCDSWSLFHCTENSSKQKLAKGRVQQKRQIIHFWWISVLPPLSTLAKLIILTFKNLLSTFADPNSLALLHFYKNL